MDRADDQTVPLAALGADAVEGQRDYAFLDLACASIATWGSEFEVFHRGLLYPLHTYNTTFRLICKGFYYINSEVLGYYVFAPIAYRTCIAPVMLVYPLSICYHYFMGVKMVDFGL